MTTNESKKVKQKVFRIFAWPSSADLEFVIVHAFQGHLKVRFFNGGL